MSALVQGYSSDEDVETDTNDMFGVSRIQAAKKLRVESEMKLTTEAAPHVLAEVGNYFLTPESVSFSCRTSSIRLH
jgi:hypothetical protein